MSQSAMKKQALSRFLILAAVLALAAFSNNPYVINLLVVCGLYALPAIGLSLLMGYTGQISLGQSAFVGVGAYGSVLLAQHLQLDPWYSLALATALSAFTAWSLGWLVFRLKGHHLAMATLAIALILHTVLVEWRSVTGGPDGISAIDPISIAGYALLDDLHFLPLAWLVCYAGLCLADYLVRSPFGLAMRTVSENEAVARSLGIDAAQVKRKVMALSGAYAGLGGALYAHWIGYISPEPFSVAFSIKLLLIVALGGVSGVWNVLFGVFIVVIVSEWLKPLGRLDVVIYGLLLIVVMIYCRQGAVAALAGLYRKLPQRLRPGARAGLKLQGRTSA
ncbi:branched-chain amino acid ABC transporter permease [Azoarcus indigens]|uniref:Amino acid/amide ABC transporter membrane protein 2 (HAAT family) n=1 Tax=Azoarcus indigens TaxID=29545 RepID=A0A4R6DFW3_9RHOO|nr:branched-chain amino acid ABC transporter permease [Azoarcus indigens]TDN43511.1 amino acid/amide ABC transporter membrane protein 2 (HAAT family) [Azoarcus indigens]